MNQKQRIKNIIRYKNTNVIKGAKSDVPTFTIYMRREWIHETLFVCLEVKKYKIKDATKKRVTVSRSLGGGFLLFKGVAFYNFFVFKKRTNSL